MITHRFFDKPYADSLIICCTLKFVMVKYLVCKLTHLIHIKTLLGPNHTCHMTTLLISQPHDRNCGFHFNPMTQCLLTCNFPRYQTTSPSGFMCVHMLMTTGLVLTPSGSSIMIHPRAPLISSRIISSLPNCSSLANLDILSWLCQFWGEGDWENPGAAQEMSTY